jgi:RND family efflux transporter MFP subunit
LSSLANARRQRGDDAADGVDIGAAFTAGERMGYLRRPLRAQPHGRNPATRIGQITAVHFADGATVRRGELLFTIDRRPFAAALAEAGASLASARSELALARADAQRADNLVGEDAVSKSELDRLHARVQAGIAAVAGAQARADARSLDLEFTEVRAPIAGRVSYRRVDPGNLVATGEGGSGTLLTTVNALDPIYFVFDASEALYLKALRAKQGGAKMSAIEVRLQDEADYRWRGALDFTDNGLDPRSGTIRLRAVVDNPGLFLAPGMFGNMRLASGGATTALLVPDAAIQTDQARKVVLTVSKDGTVEAKPVVLGPVVDGLRIVRSGLAPNDNVVVGGVQMAVPGSKVLTRPGSIKPAAPLNRSLTPATAGEATLPPRARPRRHLLLKESTPCACRASSSHGRFSPQSWRS